MKQNLVKHASTSDELCFFRASFLACWTWTIRLTCTFTSTYGSSMLELAHEFPKLQSKPTDAMGPQHVSMYTSRIDHFIKITIQFCTCLQRMVVKQMWPTNMYIYIYISYPNLSKSCFQYDFIAYNIWPPSANPSAGPRFPNTTREDDAKPKSRALSKCMCHWNLKELQIKQRWMFSKNQANSHIQLPWGDVVSGHQKKGWPMLTGYINLNLLEGCNRITYLPIYDRTTS